MGFNPDIHHRQSIRLRDFDYSSAGAYFVTICAYQKECLFGDIQNQKVILSDIGKIIEEEWIKTSDIRQEIELDEWVIMPNHIHGILWIHNDVGASRWLAFPREPGIPETYPIGRDCYMGRATGVAPTLGSIMSQFKSVVTKRIERQGLFHGSVWQRNYYERVIRSEDELQRIREYIWNNPMEWEKDEENLKQKMPRAFM